MTPQMLRAVIDGVELEYQQIGSGEPVVFVHAGIFSDFFVPLIEEPTLAGRYRMVNYHRVGCAGSSRPPGPVSIAQEAQHCRSLMRHLGIERAHIVGHSNSGNLVLQLAMDAPEAVHSLVVAEPALMTVPSAQTARAFIGVAIQQHRAGDKAGAIDTFLKGTCGPDYRAVVDAVLPDAITRYAADADTFFFYAKTDGQCYEMKATFIRAIFDDRSAHQGEYELQWVDPQNDLASFFHECHAWAVSRI